MRWSQYSIPHKFRVQKGLVSSPASIAGAARRWSGLRGTPFAVAAKTSCPPVNASDLRPWPVEPEAVLTTFSRYLLRACTGLAIGYAALTAYLLIRVSPVPITVIPKRGDAGEGEPSVYPAPRSAGMRGCH